MQKLKQHTAHLALPWTVGESAQQRDAAPAGVPYEKTPQAVLRQMGLVLAGALGFTAAVNVALVALHIG